MRAETASNFVPKKMRESGGHIDRFEAIEIFFAPFSNLIYFPNRLVYNMPEVVQYCTRGLDFSMKSL